MNRRRILQEKKKQYNNHDHIKLIFVNEKLTISTQTSLTWHKLGWIFLEAGSQVEWWHTGDTGGVRLESEYQSAKNQQGSGSQPKHTFSKHEQCKLVQAQ